MKKLIILKIVKYLNEERIAEVTVGFFGEKGDKKGELTFHGSLFPSDIKQHQEIYFSTLSPLP